MKITIDDSKSGEERRRLLEILPMLYALEMFKTRREVAAFLGITVRSLRDKLLRHDELEKYRLKPTPMKGYDHEGRRIRRDGD